MRHTGPFLKPPEKGAFFRLCILVLKQKFLNAINALIFLYAYPKDELSTCMMGQIYLFLDSKDLSSFEYPAPQSCCDRRTKQLPLLRHCFRKISRKLYELLLSLRP